MDSDEEKLLAELTRIVEYETRDFRHAPVGNSIIARIAALPFFAAPSPAQAVGGEPDYKAAWNRLADWIEQRLLHPNLHPDYGSALVDVLSVIAAHDMASLSVPRSAPEAGEGERPAMLRAKIGGAGWFWMMPNSYGNHQWIGDEGTIWEPKDIWKVDRERSDPAALALYDAETAPREEQ
jgi:hypothetical protein